MKIDTILHWRGHVNFERFHKFILREIERNHWQNESVQLDWNEEYFVKLHNL